MLTDDQRLNLLEQLGVGHGLTPEQIREELESAFLLPSTSGNSELKPAEWAMCVLSNLLLAAT